MTALIIVIILSIVEGMTEFVPVSSTGHMILMEKLLSKFITGEALTRDFMDTFLIVVQFGAIIAVVICFWKDIHPFTKNKEILKERFSLWSKVIVGVIPAGVIGIIFDKKISEYFMDNVVIVAAALIFYGIIFIIVEKKLKIVPRVEKIGSLTYKTAILVGFFQCLAMVPGTSRSGATIIGGLLLGLSRPVAAEFSFFLAIPVMAGATLLKIMKNGFNFTGEQWMLITVGTVIAFLVAYVVIKWFMDYLRKKNFVGFGYYRIALGILVLLFLR
ncbi:MAG: undecaprenyl-diphosphate phosphatase [Fusobacteriaceae bacterium]